MLNTVIYQDYDPGFWRSLLGKKRHIEELNGALFREFGKVIGLPAAAIDQTLRALAKETKKNPIIPPLGEGPDGFISRYAEIVRNQCLRLFEE